MTTAPVAAYELIAEAFDLPGARLAEAGAATRDARALRGVAVPAARLPPPSVTPGAASIPSAALRSAR